MNTQEYCDTCQEWFPVDEETGELSCNCAADPYLADSTKELNFED